jgi:hypothetical protein
MGMGRRKEREKQRCVIGVRCSTAYLGEIEEDTSEL